MFDTATILTGLSNALSPSALFAVMLGSVIGIVVGALPGATATMAIAVLVPITFWFPPELSIIMLMGVYSSGVFGGSISAILLNIPGTPASAATCFDGYPLSRQGKAGKAISVALWSSFFGGTISGFALLLAAPLLAYAALRFGPPESMAVAIFGLVMVASLSSDNLLKGLLMGTLGMFLGTIGMDPHSGYPRFTFGVLDLVQGISVVPLLIGAFSIPEVIRMLSGSGWASVDYDMRDSWRLKWDEIKCLWKTWLVSTGIGMVVGIIPAIGPETATFLGYDQAKKMAKDKSLFGKGDIRGIAGSEAAEAVVGTSLAPMFALGIPGSGAAVALMGGLLVHGLMPGPRMFTEQTGFLMTVFIGFIFAQVAMLICGLVAARFAPQILRIPHVVLGPVIIVVSMVGSFAINNSMFDVGIMLASGIIAFFLSEAGFSVVPVVLGLILGPMFEGELARTLTISAREGFFSYMLDRPIALGIIAFTILTIVGPIISEYRKRKQGKVVDKKNADNV